MPKRTDIHKILLIGSGPIVIGQACEFDYSGSQAARALRAEGYKVVLVNSNPATIMTDPIMADAIYLQELTPESIKEIVEKERPDAVLPTMGGQTALNLAERLHEENYWEEQGIHVIGVDIDAIQITEDRQKFRDLMASGTGALPDMTFRGSCTLPESFIPFVLMKDRSAEGFAR